MTQMSRPRLLDDPRFRAWFARSLLVSRDSAGQPSPLVLYHGTRRDFDVFDPSRGGEYGSGIYLTPDPGAAWMYASRCEGGGPEIIVPVYARLERPLIPRDREAARSRGPTALKRMGYDGIHATSPTGEVQVVVFDPRQVKSIFNSGLFDRDSPSLSDAHGLGAQTQRPRERMRA